MEHWYNKGNNFLSISFLPQHWNKIRWGSNGAKKNKKEDTCYDFNVNFLGVFFNYTNFNYSKHLN